MFVIKYFVKISRGYGLMVGDADLIMEVANHFD